MERVNDDAATGAAWAWRIGGVLALGAIVTTWPRVGRPLLVVVVLSMLLAWTRRGGRVPLIRALPST